MASKKTTSTTPAIPAQTNITTDTFGIAIVNRDNFAIVNTENAKTACNFIADAIEVQDKSTGALAYWCAQLQNIWTETTVKGYTKLVPFLETVFKLSKSQVYNYLNAGDSIIIGTTEDGKKVYTDTWHYKDGAPDFTVKPFSCTALVRIAEFIGNDGNTPTLIAYVQKSVESGAITSEMSVSQIVDVLYANSPIKKDKKKSNKKSSKPNDSKPNDNDSNQLENAVLTFDREEIEKAKEILSDMIENLADIKTKEMKIGLNQILDILTGMDKVKEAVKVVEGK